MKIALRVAIMSTLTATAAAVMLGQDNGGVAFPEVFIFLGLPVFAIIMLLVRLEHLLGRTGVYIIMLAGLLPVVLTIVNNTGDNLGATTAIVSGMAWSSAWLVSSMLGRDTAGVSPGALSRRRFRRSEQRSNSGGPRLGG